MTMLRMLFHSVPCQSKDKTQGELRVLAIFRDLSGVTNVQMQRCGIAVVYIIRLTWCLPSSICPCLPQTVALCVRGTGQVHTSRRQECSAIGLEPLHLPREVTLPFMSQLKCSSHALHSVNDKRSQDNLATPNTNNAVTVRNRSSRAPVVRAGLRPLLSVYCSQSLPSFVLSRSILGAAADDPNGFPSDK